MPLFKIDDAEIRYHPRGEDSVFDARDEGMVVGTVLKLAGWTLETASITRCLLVMDKTLPVGTLLIRPVERIPHPADGGSQPLAEQS